MCNVLLFFFTSFHKSTPISKTNSNTIAACVVSSNNRYRSCPSACRIYRILSARDQTFFGAKQVAYVAYHMNHMAPIPPSKSSNSAPGKAVELRPKRNPTRTESAVLASDTQDISIDSAKLRYCSQQELHQPSLRSRCRARLEKLRAATPSGSRTRNLRNRSHRSRSWEGAVAGLYAPDTCHPYDKRAPCVGMLNVDDIAPLCIHVGFRLLSVESWCH